VTPRSFGGIGGITDEDRGYGGSRFSDVCEALFAIPYRRTWGAGGEPPPPVHPVTAMHIDRRLVSDGNTHALILPSTDVLLLLGGPVRQTAATVADVDSLPRLSRPWGYR
jgi:hypothetical protein